MADIFDFSGMVADKFCAGSGNAVCGQQQGGNNLSQKSCSGCSKVMYEPLTPDFAKRDGLPEFVSNEVDDISGFFDSFGIAGHLPRPYVFLSDKVICSSYGKLSEEDLIDILRIYANTMKKTSMYEYFMEIINTIIHNLEREISERNECANPEERWSDFDPTLPGAERIVALEGTEEDKKVLAEIIDIVSSRKVSNTLLLGEYLPERHQIIIYYDAIEQETDRSKGPRMDFNAKLSSVLAHEYFHAMHYAMAPGNVLWNNSRSRGKKAYQKKEIKEALADFFSVFWCYHKTQINQGFGFMDVAQERFDSWKKHLYSAWPYSKALYLMRNPDDKRLPARLDDESIRNGYDAFLTVLEESIHNIAISYELLRRGV